MERRLIAAYSAAKASCAWVLAPPKRRGPQRFRADARCAGTPRARRASRPHRLRWAGEEQFGHPHQVAGGDHVLSLCMRAIDAAVAALAQAPGGLGPAEDLLDALAQLLAEGVRRGQAYAPGLLPGLEGRVRHDALLAGTIDELARVVALVGAYCFRPEAAVAQ